MYTFVYNENTVPSNSIPHYKMSCKLAQTDIFVRVNIRAEAKKVPVAPLPPPLPLPPSVLNPKSVQRH